MPTKLVLAPRIFRPSYGTEKYWHGNTIRIVLILSSRPSKIITMAHKPNEEIKIFDKLLEIGNTKNVSALKKDPIYSSFKGHRKITHVYIRELIKVLVKRKFHDESIYWCDRFLKCCDHSDKRMKRNILTTLMLNYWSIRNYEKVLKLGHEALAIPLDPR